MSGHFFRTNRWLVTAAVLVCILSGGLFKMCIRDSMLSFTWSKVVKYSCRFVIKDGLISGRILPRQNAFLWDCRLEAADIWSARYLASKICDFLRNVFLFSFCKGSALSCILTVTIIYNQQNTL